jgi:hypothetical protein
MAGRVNKRNAGDPLKIPAKEWNAIADAVNFGVSQSRGGGQLAQSITVLVRNDAGEDLDRYDCASLGDPMFTLESDGSVDLMFALVKADPAKPPAILTEPIAHDATNKRYGRVWIHGLAYAFVGPGATTSLFGLPTATDNILTPGSGNVRLLGAPSASETLLLPVLLGASGNAANKFACRLMAAWSARVVSCEIYKLDGATVIYEETADVYDPLSVFAALDVDDWQYCTLQDGKYYAADPGGCPGTSPLIASPPESQPSPP